MEMYNGVSKLIIQNAKISPKIHTWQNQDYREVTKDGFTNQLLKY